MNKIKSCHEDVILRRKSHKCTETAFVQGDSAGGSKLTEQTLQHGGKNFSNLAKQFMTS